MHGSMIFCCFYKNNCIGVSKRFIIIWEVDMFLYKTYKIEDGWWAIVNLCISVVLQ